MPVTRSHKKGRADSAASTPAGPFTTTTPTTEHPIDTDNIGLEDLPLELLAAIADYVHTFSHLAAMMLVSRRLHDGVSLSRQYRIADEVMIDIGDEEQMRWILFDRQETVLHASRLGNTRLLRYVQLTREEAYSVCLPVACVCGHLEFVRYLVTEYGIKDKVGLSQTSFPKILDCGGCVAQFETQFRSFKENDIFKVGPFEIACACPTGLPLAKYFHEECGVSEVPLNALICAAGEGRLDTVKYLHTEFGLTAVDAMRYLKTMPQEDNLNAFMWACQGGHLPVVDYLLTALGLTAADTRHQECPVLVRACSGGRLPVVEYLHTAFGLTVDDARAESNLALRLACCGGHLPVVQYLHAAFGLTAEDARADENYSLRISCCDGHLPVVEYLHTAFGLTTDDARAGDNYALRVACDTGHLPLVKYLHTAFGLTADDARVDNTRTLRSACECGHDSVVEYLHTAFGLTVDDARTEDNYALRLACDGGHLPVVKYLHTAFGLTADDARAHSNDAIMWACSGGCFPVVLYLLKGFGLKADDCKDALQWAYNFGDSAMVKCLSSMFEVGATIGELDATS